MGPIFLFETSRVRLFLVFSIELKVCLILQSRSYAYLLPYSTSRLCGCKEHWKRDWFFRLLNIARTSSFGTVFVSLACSLAFSLDTKSLLFGEDPFILIWKPATFIPGLFDIGKAADVKVRHPGNEVGKRDVYTT